MKTSANTAAIVLASASPRRRELLVQLGVHAAVAPADIDESVRPQEKPSCYVLRLARSKASKIASAYQDSLVIGADTTIAEDDRILGKPDNREHAVEMLTTLAGRTHLVQTGVAVAQGDDIEALVVTTQVKFQALTIREIQDYVATGESVGKAGAYAIQGLGAVLIDKIEGSYSNVVGLPLAETAALLRRFGFSVLSASADRHDGR